MEYLKKKWPKWDCYILFTVSFCIVSMFFAGVFEDAGKTFIPLNDGVSQHFNTFLYTGRYLRSNIAGIIKGRGISAPMMNYTLGQGTDMILALNGYDLLNPVCMLSVIIFGHDMFFAYRFMVFANLFLAGISFCIYCRTVGRKDGYIIASGALIYTFCGFAINFCTRHPNFVSGTYYLPLMLASAELVIRKNKKLPLILTVFFSLMTSYYSFYMIAICFVFYLILRFFPCPKNEIKSRLLIIVKTGIVAIVGGMLSAVWLLPAVFGTLINNGGYQTALGYSDSWILYPLEYYKDMIECFTISAGSPGFKNYLGFFPITLVCFVTLFIVRKKEYRRLRLALCIGFLGMCVPLVGLAMNGFRYVNNRWTYAFAFIAAFVFVETAGELPKLIYRQIALILAVALVFILWWFIDPEFDRMDNIPLMLLLVTIAVVLLCGRPYISKKIVPACLLILMILSAIANITLLYNTNYGGYVNSFADAADGYNIYTRFSTARVANSADDDAFYRVEMQEERENTEGYNNVNGTTFYGGTIDGNYQKFYADTQLSSCSNFVQTLGLSGCTSLLDLASVKYYTLPDRSAEAYVPYGFYEGDEFVYNNSHYLAPAFLYDKYITYEDFKNRNPVDRQRAMIQGAVLGEGTGYAENIVPKTRVNEVEYETVLDDISFSPGQIYAEEEGGTITLLFDPQPGCELYLWLDGIAYDSSGVHAAVLAESGCQDGSASGVIKSVLLSTPNYEYYVHRDGVCFNLGYSESGYDQVKIRFESRGNYAYNGIHVIANPMDTYMEDLDDLKSASCDGITIADDGIYGSVESGTDALLELSVPYSIGWRAYIDGKKAPVLRSNIMYTALEIPAGSHEISMRYRTPFLLAGLIISLITLAGMTSLAVLDKKGLIKI